MMRRLLIAVFLIVLVVPVGAAAEEAPRLVGVAFTEGVADAIELQVWALGAQVEAHPEWQYEAVFAGDVTPGRAFSVDLGEARLPVLVELAAKGHAAVALHVVIPDQLSMPAAWLRKGEPIRLRVSRPDRGDERMLVWGDAWVDRWGWDGRRWRVAVPHLPVPKSGSVEITLPSPARALWVVGVDESGAFGTVQLRDPTTGRVALKIDSAPIAVRVWDERKRPVAGVRVADASTPLQLAAVTDDEGRARVQVPMHGDWNIVATDSDSIGLKTGRGRPEREIDLDLGPRVNIDLQWPENLGTAVIVPSSRGSSFGVPLAFPAGKATLPKLPSVNSIGYWGPEIAPGMVRVSDYEGALPLQARAAVRIEGRVVSEPDVPLAGLPVWMRISSSANSLYRSYGGSGRSETLERPWLPWAVTDGAGRFSIAGLPAAACEVEVRAPGMPVARSQRLEGEPGAVLETTVTLRAGAALDLRVMDPDGVPLAGVTIDLYRSDDRSNRSVFYGGRTPPGDPELTAFTDEEGRGHLASVPVGTVRLRLHQPGSVSRTVDKIEVPAEGVDIGDQVLQPGVSLIGITLGPDGEPVGGAEVSLERNPQVPVFQTAATSDEDGRFSIPDLEPSGEVYLQARAEGLVPEAPLKVEMPPEDEIEVAMAVERVLEGLVLDALDDSPIEGAVIYLTMQRDTGMQGSGVFGSFRMTVGDSKTDASGRFLFDGLSAGEFEMRVSADARRVLSRTVVIGEADPEAIVIRLEAGLELRGRVVTSGGEPAIAMTVSARPASQDHGGGSTLSSRTQSDADGRFHFDDLGPGPQSVMARSEKGQTAQATAEAGQSDEVVLRFPRGTTISGTVFDPDGSPLNGAKVRGYNRQPFQSVSDETGADGRFELTDAAPGTWMIGASADGLITASEEVEVRENEPARVDLRLEHGATVIGEIRGLVESELEGCMVRIDGGGNARPAADGSFRVTGVPSGERQVVAVEMTTHRSRSVGVTVPESGESDWVVIDFASGLTVFGRVLRGGAGVSGLTVSVSGVASAGSGQTISGENGGWRVEGLEPGEYQLVVQSRSGEALVGDHVLLEVDTELDLHVPSGYLGGRVLEAETRRPIEGAAVTITSSEIPPIRRSVVSDAAGAFQFSELGDGDFIVSTVAEGRAPAQERITLSDGAARELTLLLEKETATVLVVREPDGLPASGIYIHSLSGGTLGPSISVVCADGGRCPVDDLPRGQWTVLVHGRGAALLVLDIPGSEVPVQLKATGRLTIDAPADDSGAAWQVRLSDAATGLVVPVTMWSNPGRGEWVPVHASGFGLKLPEGQWRVEAYAPDGTASTREVTIPGGGEITVELE